MGSICPCLSPAEELDEEQLREIAIGKDIDSRKSELIYLPYARHHNPRFVYFSPIFEGQKRFLRSFFRKILTLYRVKVWIL